MADPLTVLGGVAASVQLIDVAAKQSKELYSFFRSVRGANADTRRQLEVLNDLQAVLGLVVSFISSSSIARSRNPIDNGYTKLETVLQKLCDDLRSIQVLIPPGPHISFAAKMRWTLKRKEFEARLKEIESRKSSLLTILELLTMQEQKLLLGKTDDIEAAMQDLNMHVSHTRAANTAILDSVSTLSTNTAANRIGTEQALRDMAHLIPCDGDKTRMAIEAHGEQLHRFGDMLFHHSTYIGGWMSAQTQLLQDLATALPQETSRIGDRLNDLMRLASATSPCSRQTISEYKVVPKTEHLIARIARDEIRRAMTPVLEALAQSQVRNEKLAKSFNEVLEDVSSRLWDDNQLDERLDRQSATSQQHAIAAIPQIRDDRNRTNPEYSHTHTRENTSEVSDSNFSSDECEIKKELERLNCQTRRQPLLSSDGKCAKYQKIWTYWSSISWLGNIRIEIRRRKTGGDIRPLVQATFLFWPPFGRYGRFCAAEACHCSTLPNHVIMATIR